MSTDDWRGRLGSPAEAKTWLPPAEGEADASESLGHVVRKRRRERRAALRIWEDRGTRYKGVARDVD